MKKPSYSRFGLLALILFTAHIIYGARVERLIDAWQPKHYVVNIALNEQLSEIASATARIDVLILKPTSLIDLDFGELTIDAVTLDSKPASFTHKDGKLKNQSFATCSTRHAVTSLSAIPRQTKRRLDSDCGQRQKPVSRWRQLA